MSVQEMELNDIINRDYRIDELEQEVKRLRDNADKCYCAFCSDNIERTWDELKSHMLTCQKHPLFITNKELETTKRQLKESLIVLNYYARDGGRDQDDVELLVQNFSGHLLDVQVGGQKAREFLNKLKN